MIKLTQTALLIYADKIFRPQQRFYKEDCFLYSFHSRIIDSRKLSFNNLKCAIMI